MDHAEFERRFDRITASIEAHDRQIEAHDRQIEALIIIAEKQDQRWRELEKQWQAYLNTIHPRQ